MLRESFWEVGDANDLQKRLARLCNLIWNSFWEVGAPLTSQNDLLAYAFCFGSRCGRSGAPPIVPQRSIFLSFSCWFSVLVLGVSVRCWFLCWFSVLLFCVGVMCVCVLSVLVVCVWGRCWCSVLAVCVGFVCGLSVLDLCAGFVCWCSAFVFSVVFR